MGRKENRSSCPCTATYILKNLFILLKASRALFTYLYRISDFNSARIRLNFFSITLTLMFESFLINTRQRNAVFRQFEAHEI